MPWVGSSTGSFTRCAAATSCPQHHSFPSTPTAAECASPAATVATRHPERASTRLGRRSSATAAGWPHWPRALSPHDQTHPDRSTERACPSEVEMSIVCTRSLLPNPTRLGESTAPISPAEGGSSPRGARPAPHAHSSPQQVTANEWWSPAAMPLTRRPGARRTRRGNGRAASSPCPNRPPTPRPQEKRAPAASAKRVWCLAAATRLSPRGSAVSPRAAATSHACSSSELGGAGSFARAGRLSSEAVPAGRPRGRQPAWPQVYTSPETGASAAGVGGPCTSCSSASGDRPSWSSGPSTLAPPNRTRMARAPSWPRKQARWSAL
eukprot:scaffold3954_cov109-Isochrysis_galbana.AAC.2